MFKKVMALSLLMSFSNVNAAPGGFQPWTPYPGPNSNYYEIPRCKKLDYEMIHRITSRDGPTFGNIVDSALDACRPGTTFEPNGLCQWAIDVVCWQVESQRAAAISPFKP